MKNKNLHLINRQPAVAGSFYPGNQTELKSTLESFFNKAKEIEHPGSIRALIAPHAGYVFSGFVAASAYRQLDREAEYEHIFVIGSSHHTGFYGASIYNIGNYETPLGETEVDVELASKLIKGNSVFTFNEEAHNREHSLEVQLPFLQYWLKKPFKIIPIILGSQDPDVSEKIADALIPWFKSGNLFVFSTDLSHYPTWDGANKADANTIKGILSGSPDQLLQVLEENEKKNYPGLLTSMCGWPAVLSLLDMTSSLDGLSYHKVLYKNSGDTPYGDHQRVVGYVSVIVTDDKSSDENAFLSEEDKKTLLQIARNTLTEKIVNNRFSKIETGGFSPALLTPAGAFVTLHTVEGQLRGCIGRFQPDIPLYKVVKEMTISAALNDYRFSPVKAEEIPSLDIEISVLTPLKKINSIDELELGKDGIYIRNDGRSGTFLPQVAESTGWSKEEFLGHCSRDKAGLGWDGWKDADLFTYQAIIFSEKEMGIGH
jgi:AmmeMemoRadiSam system protein B/AmmeMemoRadiSam system protein A